MHTSTLRNLCLATNPRSRPPLAARPYKVTVEIDRSLPRGPRIPRVSCIVSVVAQTVCQLHVRERPRTLFHLPCLVVCRRHPRAERMTGEVEALTTARTEALRH